MNSDEEKRRGDTVTVKYSIPSKKRSEVTSGEPMVKSEVLLTFLMATCLLTGCARNSYLLYPPPSDSLADSAARLQLAIARAEESGCRVENVAIGAGHGVGVGLGIGVGHGVGVGINIAPDCPECVGRDDLNKVVEQTKETRDTKIERQSMFAPIALASCPWRTKINEEGVSQ